MKRIGTLLAVFLLFSALVPSVSAASPLNDAQIRTLAHFCAETAPDEPLLVQMSLAAVIRNRMEDPRYPDTLDGNLACAGFACAPVRTEDLEQSLWAVRCVLRGMDPTAGAVQWAKEGSAAAGRMTVTLQADGWCFGK